MPVKNRSDEITAEEEYYSSVKKFFRLLAPFYDSVTAFDARLRGTVVDFTHAKMGSKILDVATGTGKQAFAFAEKGYDVIGVDLSEDMLGVAEKKNKDKKVSFEVADATNLPFEDNSFDVSCVSFALHDMPLFIRKRVLKEMIRVTKLDGTIVIADYGLPKNGMGRFLIYHLVKLYEKYYPEFIKSDLEGLLRKSGAEIAGELPLFLGAARIIKGISKAANVARIEKGGDNIVVRPQTKA